MAFLIYDYVDPGGANQIKPWIGNLQVKERAKFDALLDKLHMHGEVLRPEILAGTDVPGISKLRVHGGVQLRPLLCTGPIDVKTEFTLLIGAIEVGGKLKPKGVEQTATLRKQMVKSKPLTARTLNERYTK